MKLVSTPVLLMLVTRLSGGEAATSGWDTNVLDLMRLDRRDSALTALLRQAKYPPEPAYREERSDPIKEVVLCPQTTNLPMFAVFLRSSYTPVDSTNNRSGHFILFSADGTIIPAYSGANSLDGRFEDFNGDGILDCVDAWCMGFGEYTFSGLHVIPVTPAQQPVLQILYDDERLSWRSVPSTNNVTQRIQLGRQTNHAFTVVAEYTWSSASATWEGPDGGLGRDFIRVRADAEAAAARLHQGTKERKGSE